MFTNQNIPYKKRKTLLTLLVIVCISGVCVAYNLGDDDDFITAKREVLLRRLGHELLLQSGDSTSRVLPVEKISENEYEIKFENNFSFQPELLVATTRRLLVKEAFAQDYIVSVYNCNNSRMVYGYSISESIKDNIVPCKGRKQPKACYYINIKFKPAVIASKNIYWIACLPFLAVFGFMAFTSFKPKKSSTSDDDTGLISLGAVLFDAKNKKLTIHETDTDLTATETRLLLIFAVSPNETIARSRLQKEIWEDEGVIVGRSLDMFISKLRKKLELDPNISIVAVRGKGYKLEINTQQ
ncbi:winged helix-turn-helix domain-containing protein [Flavobacterium sp. RNTU_13]|uniref:winged helix-turn-helix domain-containing protein n=1 Tax=Flavobacterium sp. RNTU_13 TaxID=3375145 RepID=UPI0039885897